MEPSAKKMKVEGKLLTQPSSHYMPVTREAKPIVRIIVLRIYKYIYIYIYIHTYIVGKRDVRRNVAASVILTCTLSARNVTGKRTVRERKLLGALEVPLVFC